MVELRFITSADLWWPGVLKGVAKSSLQLQPIFEAITNSLESIEIFKQKNPNNPYSPYIIIEFYYNQTLDNQNGGLYSIKIIDNGQGFDKESFKRLTRYKDDTKGFKNRGSGRIQLVHYFNKAIYQSVFQNTNQLQKRSFTLSKNQSFLNQNSIIYNDGIENVASDSEQITTLSLEGLLDERDVKFYDDLSIDELKDIVINRYLLYFFSHKKDRPIITLNRYLNGKLIETKSITEIDIPEPTTTNESINVPKCRISTDMKRIETTDNNVVINIQPYKLSSDKIKKNEIRITSKGEIVDKPKVRITCLESDAVIDNARYLFLLSSDYFDEIAGDIRGELEILDKTEFKKEAKEFGFIKEQVILNDIESGVNERAQQIYAEIASKAAQQERIIDTLKNRYLLDDNALAEASINDSVEDILKKAYTYDAKLLAKQDAEYDEKVKALEDLDTTSKTYQEELDNIVKELVKTIPLQNRASLSRYVARRKMVIDLLGKILDKKTRTQQERDRNIDEKILHNLLFTQHQNNSNESDLWLLSEEYLYFKGCSDIPLNQIEIDGKKLFREAVAQEEERYLTSNGQDRRLKRPDMLLFPSEGKCIIVELKNPQVDVSLHLSQINKYAYFIRNFATSDFIIDTFYGYLIGEAIEPREVRAADGNFILAPKFKYLYRPNTIIPDDSGTNRDGNLYTEVIQYSVLKERAETRNKAFIEKLYPITPKESQQLCEIDDCDIINDNEISYPKQQGLF